MRVTEEGRRLDAASDGVPWKKWGPYLSERQWGTVREDYSADGDAWDYFTHDQARSRAYRWGEDGLAGISDDKQRLCFALALWNGRDPILKERLFGLTNSEGNHGEDVKEYYFYLDTTPTHSYMKYLYKYPQAAYPYADLVADEPRGAPATSWSTSCWTPASSTTTATSTSSSSTPRRRPRTSSIRITAFNRGPEAADPAPAAHPLVPQHLVAGSGRRTAASPASAAPRRRGTRRRWPRHARRAGRLRSSTARATRPLLFTENETNHAAALRRDPTPTPYVKDGINDYVVHGRTEARQPGRHRHQGRRPLQR